MSVDTVPTDPVLLVDRHDRTAILTLNRPQARNAMNPELAQAIAATLEELDADDDIWVIVLTGNGDRAFCAGKDLKVVANRTGPASHPPGGWGGVTHRALLKPLIAAVNGAALGGGLEICLSADCVIADEHATFGLPEVRRGLMAGAGGIERLPRRIPPALAMELILTGRVIDASRALEIGLINRVVPSGSCVQAALELADEICLGAPLAVRYSKAVARASISIGEADALKSASELRRAVVASEDIREGRRAFIEKRPPVWKGR
jgi:enoyl-CoA hydratase/carnithine racemase